MSPRKQVYVVTQFLGKTRVLEVEATSATQARALAQAGEGEVVEGLRARYGLLADDAFVKPVQP